MDTDGQTANPPDSDETIESLWEYGDPSLSETRFRKALATADGDYALELETQVARSLGLQGRFDEAHAALDAVEKRLGGAGARPRTRYLLERGRAFNSGGEKERARPLFAGAWEAAEVAGLEGLAVDAAHMLAIISSETPQALEWNERGLRMARESQDQKARALIPAMLNNGAWDLHGMGKYDEALALFQEAEIEWARRGGQEQIQIARWSVARCLRSLGRHREALAILHDLEIEHSRAGTSDGYVFEELAENLAAMGRADEARANFRRAHDELSKDAWFVENETRRLARLREGGGLGAQ